MELRHLRYFAALAETLNFTRAAERVHVTQPTLSHQIRQLEEQLGRPLFERGSKRVALTEAGEVLLDYVTRALKEVDQGLSTLKQNPDELSGLLRIGATHTFNVEFIPACVAAFLDRYATVKIVVEELSADAINSGLRSGDLDLGIAYKPTSKNSPRFEPLYNEEMVLVVSDKHPFAARKRIRMVELHGQRLVLLPESFATRHMLDECFDACGAEPIVVAEMNAIAPMIGLAACTTIGAIVARNAVPAMHGLRVVLLENPTPTRTPGILWPRKAKQLALTRSFAATVRKIALDGSRRSPTSRGARRK